MLGADTDRMSKAEFSDCLIIMYDVRNTCVGGMSLRVDGSLQLPVSCDWSKP